MRLDLFLSEESKIFCMVLVYSKILSDWLSISLLDFVYVIRNIKCNIAHVATLILNFAHLLAVSWNWGCEESHWEWDVQRHLFWRLLRELPSLGSPLWRDDSKGSSYGHHPSRYQQAGDWCTCQVLLWGNGRFTLVVLTFSYWNLWNMYTKEW